MIGHTFASNDIFTQNDLLLSAFQSAHRSSTRQCRSSVDLTRCIQGSGTYRVEGFHPHDFPLRPAALQAIALHLADDGSGGGTTMTMSAHQHRQHHGFDLPDPFRKLPSSVNMVVVANVEFNGELPMATLVGGPGD